MGGEHLYSTANGGFRVSIGIHVKGVIVLDMYILVKVSDPGCFLAQRLFTGVPLILYCDTQRNIIWVSLQQAILFFPQPALLFFPQPQRGPQLSSMT